MAGATGPLTSPIAHDRFARRCAPVVLIAAGCSRVLLTGIGIYALTVFGESPTRPALDAAVGDLDPWLAIWYRWDAYWYVLIAERGYTGELHNAFPDLRANFLPAYPALIATIGRVAGGPIAGGLIVSNLACLVFLAGLWRLAAEQFGQDTADRAVWLYCLFPASFFLSSIYTESLMLAAAVWALLSARRRQWWTGGFYAALAALARPTGFLVTLMVLLSRVEAWRAGERRGLVSQTAGLALPTAAVLMLYLTMASAVFDNAFATLVSQAQAGRVFIAAPLEALQSLWNGNLAIHGYGRSLVDTVTAAGALVTLPFVFRQLGVAQGVYAAGCVLVPLATGTISFLRLVLVAFPLFVVIAAALRAPLWNIAVLAGFGMLSGLAMALFATWRWVG